MQVYWSHQPSCRRPGRRARIATHASPGRTRMSRGRRRRSPCRQDRMANSAWRVATKRWEVQKGLKEPRPFARCCERPLVSSSRGASSPHWAGPTEVALQTLLGAAHTPASDRQGLYITVLTYTRDTLSGRHALRPTIDVPTRSGTPNAPRDTCARPRVHTHNGRKPARVHQRGPN